MTLDDCSRLLEAYDKLYCDCRCLDHMHPPTVLLPAMREVWRLKQEIGYKAEAQGSGAGTSNERKDPK